MAKVSAILPVYNDKKFLKKCLDSLISQTLTDIEIILVNDGSTDSSLEILNEYSKKDSRIRIIDEKNHNAGYARNQGLKIAKGEYLSFLDSDDFYKKTMLEKAYARAKEVDADVCIYKSYLYDNETGNSKVNAWSVKEDFLPKKDVFAPEEVESNIFKSIMCWPWDKMFKRSFILENGFKFQSQRTTNDMYFVFSALLKAERITVLSEELYYQRRNISTSLSNTREQSWDCFYNALIRLKDELISRDIYDIYKKDFINYALKTCLWNLNTVNEPMARQLFEKLITEWFDNLDINNHPEIYFENKYDYFQYSIINQIPLDDLKAYETYKNCLMEKKENFKETGKVNAVLSDEEKLHVSEAFDNLTLKDLPDKYR